MFERYTGLARRALCFLRYEASELSPVDRDRAPAARGAAYPDGGIVIDSATKQIAARIPTSEKLIEIDFENGQPVRAGHR